MSFLSAYRELLKLNVLLRVIEEREKTLDNKNFVGTVLMNLSKAFDYIYHYLLIAKLHAYGSSKEVCILIFKSLENKV